jgi:hypothetical protein
MPEAGLPVLRFERAADGTAASLITEELTPLVLERVPAP